MEENNFVCTSRDCNLKFSSEDSLQLHKKRHEMVLTLNKSNLPSSDQTPTPVRFIRQCEEIGLFQDLQNVNPFEETFRKAAEAVKKGSIPKQQVSILSQMSSDELHTPHIFPDEANIECNMEGDPARSNSEKDIMEEVVIRTEADTSLKTSIIRQQHLSPPVPNELSTTVVTTEAIMRDQNCQLESITTDEPIRVTTVPTFTANLSDSTFPVQTDPVQVLLRMPNGSLVQLATKPVTNTIVPVNVTPSSLHIEETVKVLPNAGTNGSTVILATKGGQRPSGGLPEQSTTTNVKQKLKQLLGGTSKMQKQQVIAPRTAPLVNNNENVVAKKPSKNNDSCDLDDAEKEKRRKILERNRKAAVRSRERRKRWVEDLRKRADAMALTNRTLNDEISKLKAEVANLRTLLLAHADCPVTLAQSSSHESICLPSERNEVASKRARRDGLTLDIEQATRSVVPTVDLDTPTPTIVRSDKVLSSVAPPATPEQDRLVTFGDILPQDRNGELTEEIVEDRHLTPGSISGGTTTVIQINPNAVKPSHSFS